MTALDLKLVCLHKALLPSPPKSQQAVSATHEQMEVAITAMLGFRVCTQYPVR